MADQVENGGDVPLWNGGSLPPLENAPPLASAPAAPHTGDVLLHDPSAGHWLQFKNPLRILATTSPTDVLNFLHELQHEIDAHGLHAAGFLSYEAASGLDPALVVQPGGTFPLAWFGLYREPTIVPGPCSLSEIWCPPFKAREASNTLKRAHQTLDWQPTTSQPQYHEAIRRIRDYIRNGDTYQVNYSMRLQAPFSGEPRDLFASLVQAQGPHYAAFIETEDWAVCCASPELFFRLDGAELLCRPIKGTTPRGLWPAQDLERGRSLRASEKNQAENVMIVDMVRNDLGRVARPGTVRVGSLFDLEKYPTLWHLVSSISCETQAPLPDIFRALFPAASITGAPKVRTMQLIAELENSPRKIYTGSIGYIAPQRRAQFNVAIRTVLIDKPRRLAEYGVGGGIVWDSSPADEYNECQTKARILTLPTPDFALLETLRWTPAEGFFLLDAHLDRLAASADYFSRPAEIPEIRRRLAQLASTLPQEPHRIRLLLGRDGSMRLEPAPLAAPKTPFQVCLAKTPVHSGDVFLYHKTTHRQIYENALAACPGVDDVLLWNEKGELTESTIANVAVVKGEQWLTPPLECGLLPGTFRAQVLGEGRAREEVIRVDELQAVDAIYLFNSVRGIWPAALVPSQCQD